MVESNWLRTLSSLDKNLLRFINVDLNSSSLTPLMELVSSSRFGVLASLLVILFVCFWPPRTVLWKKALFLSVTISTLDYLSSAVLKETFKRLRPCLAKPFEDLIYLDGCAGIYGFPSNHASNVSCFTVCLYLLGHRRLAVLLLPLALSVGFSRVYLAAHYPLDVFAGFMWGSAYAFIAVNFFKSRLSST